MLIPEQVLQIVKKSALFTGLQVDEQKALLANGRMHQVPTGSYFFQQGEEALILYIITQGRVKLTKVTENGDQIIINYFGPGQGLGIIVALSEMAYPLSAEAIEPCEAVAWHRDTIKAMMYHNSRLAVNGLEMVAKRFMQLQEQFSDVATKQVEQRVARTLLRLARQFGKRNEQGILIDIPLSRQSLAEMTGTNLYNVSRILSRWEREGLVLCRRESITLSKAHKLVIIGEGL